VAILARARSLVFHFGEMLFQMRGVIEENASASGVGIAGEFWMTVFEALELDGMARLTLGVREMLQIKIMAMMFLMADRASSSAG
jgi:hypothetical protein